jgi:phosphatidylinositol dimannoside acyltransferase
MPDHRPRGNYRTRPLPAKLRSTRRVYAETGLAKDHRELDRLVAENAAYTVGYYRRLACILEPNYRARLLRTIRPTGSRHLVDAGGLGRGLILVAPHLGDFDLAVAWIAAAIGDRLVVPVADLGRPWAQHAYGIARRACSFDLVEAGAVSSPALCAQLKKGRTVVLTLDRRSAGRTLEANFFGHPTQLSASCLQLARLSGAPLLSAATWSHPGERTLVFGEPLWPGHGYERKGDEALLQRLASDAESAIRSAPHQWHIPARLDQHSVTAPPLSTPPRAEAQARVGA